MCWMRINNLHKTIWGLHCFWGIRRRVGMAPIYWWHHTSLIQITFSSSFMKLKNRMKTPQTKGSTLISQKLLNRNVFWNPKSEKAKPWSGPKPICLPPPSLILMAATKTLTQSLHCGDANHLLPGHETAHLTSRKRVISWKWGLYASVPWARFDDIHHWYWAPGRVVEGWVLLLGQKR